jgi:hypothetical protein
MVQDRVKVGQVRLWKRGEWWCLYLVVRRQSRWEWQALLLEACVKNNHTWPAGKTFVWDVEDDSVLRDSKRLPGPEGGEEGDDVVPDGFELELGFVP